MKTTVTYNTTNNQSKTRTITKTATNALALIMSTTIFFTAYMASPFLPSAYGELEQEHITYEQVESDILAQ